LRGALREHVTPNWQSAIRTRELGAEVLLLDAQDGAKKAQTTVRAPELVDQAPAIALRRCWACRKAQSDDEDAAADE
jgi:hypothetical protein